MLATIGALVLVAALGIGLWNLGWFVEEKNVDKRTEINNRSTARQTALAEEILDKYRDIRNIDVQLTEAADEQKAPLNAQRVAILNQACDAYYQSSGKALIPEDIVAYLEMECV